MKDRLFQNFKLKSHKSIYVISFVQLLCFINYHSLHCHLVILPKGLHGLKTFFFIEYNSSISQGSEGDGGPRFQEKNQRKRGNGTIFPRRKPTSQKTNSVSSLPSSTGVLTWFRPFPQTPIKSSCLSPTITDSLLICPLFPCLKFFTSRRCTT